MRRTPKAASLPSSERSPVRGQTAYRTGAPRTVRKTYRSGRRRWLDPGLLAAAALFQALLMVRWLTLGPALVGNPTHPLTVLTVALNRIGQQIAAAPLPAVGGLMVLYLISHRGRHVPMRRLFCGLCYLLVLQSISVWTGFTIRF